MTVYPNAEFVCNACNEKFFPVPTPECLACEGNTEFVGRLGEVFYFKCRSCGLLMHHTTFTMQEGGSVLPKEERHGR